MSEPAGGFICDAPPPHRPSLSVPNWGGILLHLRGNVKGYTGAGSKNKWLRFITLPFYYHDEVEIQKSFLDAFLKGQDLYGWKSTACNIDTAKGDVGFNDDEAEKQYPKREEEAWPIPKTEYTKFHLTPDLSLTLDPPKISSPEKVSYETLGTIVNSKLVQFTTPAFETETEITGTSLPT
jgi:hypothetical protein